MEKKKIIKKEVEKAVVKTEKVEKPVREIMKDNNGKRIHLMNINMKNKILENLKWSEGDSFLNTGEKFTKESTKYYDRILTEVKTYNMNPESNKFVENHGEVTGSRHRYYLLKSKDNLFLVENFKDRTVKRYMVVK